MMPNMSVQFTYSNAVHQTTNWNRVCFCCVLSCCCTTNICLWTGLSSWSCHLLSHLCDLRFCPFLWHSIFCSTFQYFGLGWRRICQISHCLCHFKRPPHWFFGWNKPWIWHTHLFVLTFAATRNCHHVVTTTFSWCCIKIGLFGGHWQQRREHPQHRR